MRVRQRFRLRIPHDFLGKVGLTAHSHDESPDAGWRGAEP